MAKAKLQPGQTIEFVVDVSDPPNQRGIRGQTKIVERDISLWAAKYLLDGGQIRPYDPASPLQLEEEKPEKKKGPDGPVEAPGPASTEVKKERRTNDQRKRTDTRQGAGKSDREADQSRDHGIKSTKRGGRGRGA